MYCNELKRKIFKVEATAYLGVVLGEMLGLDVKDGRRYRRTSVKNQCGNLMRTVLTVDAIVFQFLCAAGAPVLPSLAGT